MSKYTYNNNNRIFNNIEVEIPNVYKSKQKLPIFDILY